jgi:hypothetical protein
MLHQCPHGAESVVTDVTGIHPTSAVSHAADNMPVFHRGGRFVHTDAREDCVRVNQTPENPFGSNCKDLTSISDPHLQAHRYTFKVRLLVMRALGHVVHGIFASSAMARMLVTGSRAGDRFAFDVAQFLPEHCLLGLGRHAKIAAGSLPRLGKQAMKSSSQAVKSSSDSDSVAEGHDSFRRELCLSELLLRVAFVEKVQPLVSRNDVDPKLLDFDEGECYNTASVCTACTTAESLLYTIV